MDQNSPLLSIIIPTLQEGKLLARTLDQFPALRSRHHLEVIVSDGLSTDGTLAIAREKADVVVEAVQGEPQNISKGRNRGARAAHGDILIFLNGDTMIEDIDTFFLTMAASMAQGGGTVGATCSVLVYKEEERASDRIFHQVYNFYFALLNTLGIGMGRGECQVVRRDDFFTVGGYNEAIAAGEDFEFFVRLRRRGKIAFLHRLVVRESPRRYRKYGYAKITLLWTLNAVGVLIFGRSVVKHWEAVR